MQLQLEYCCLETRKVNDSSLAAGVSVRGKKGHEGVVPVALLGLCACFWAVVPKVWDDTAGKTSRVEKSPRKSQHVSEKPPCHQKRKKKKLFLGWIVLYELPITCCLVFCYVGCLLSLIRERTIIFVYERHIITEARLDFRFSVE